MRQRRRQEHPVLGALRVRSFDSLPKRKLIAGFFWKTQNSQVNKTRFLILENSPRVITSHTRCTSESTEECNYGYVNGLFSVKLRLKHCPSFCFSRLGLSFDDITCCHFSGFFQLFFFPEQKAWKPFLV